MLKFAVFKKEISDIFFKFFKYKKNNDSFFFLMMSLFFIIFKIKDDTLGVLKSQTVTENKHRRIVKIVDVPNFIVSQVTRNCSVTASSGDVIGSAKQNGTVFITNTENKFKKNIFVVFNHPDSSKHNSRWLQINCTSK